jgi:hypothetical protein
MHPFPILTMHSSCAPMLSGAPGGHLCAEQGIGRPDETQGSRQEPGVRLSIAERHCPIADKIFRRLVACCIRGAHIQPPAA